MKHISEIKTCIVNTTLALEQQTCETFPTSLLHTHQKIEIETQTLLLEGTLIFLGYVALKVYF